MSIECENQFVDALADTIDENEDDDDDGDGGGVMEERDAAREVTKGRIIESDESDSDESMLDFLVNVDFNDDGGDDYSYSCSDSDSCSDCDGNSDALANGTASTRHVVPGSSELSPHWEQETNALLSEAYFLTASASASLSPDSTCVSELDHDILDAPPVMNRHTSTAFFSLSSFEALPDIDALCQFTDKNGNTACHHAAYMGLHQTFEALVAHGASRWQENKGGDTPSCLRDGFSLGTGSALSTFHKILTKRGFMSPALVPVAMQTAFDFLPAEAAGTLLDTILASDDEHDAAFLVDEAIAENLPHAKLYRAVFSVVFQYGPMQAQRDLLDYETELLAAAGTGTARLDPLYFFLRFKLWTSNNGKMSSYAKQDRLAAYDALCALRCFPATAEKWLDPDERLDEEVRQAGLDTDDPPPVLLDDDYSDLFPPLGPDDPETLWERAKAEYGMVSPAMDALMQLTGLKAVKHKAKDVCLTVLLDPPKDLQTGTSCNFTFIGNPGTGRATALNCIALHCTLVICTR